MRRQSLLLWHAFPFLLACSLVLSTHSLWAQSPELEILPEAPRSQAELHENPFHISYHYNLNHPQAALNLHVPTGAVELLGKPEYFNRITSSQWAAANGRLHYSTIKPADRLLYYSHHIPGATSSILRVSQQARAHPHVTSALKLFTPF